MVVEVLQVAQNRHRSVGLGVDPIDEIGTGQADGVLGNGLTFVPEKSFGLVPENILDLAVHEFASEMSVVRSVYDEGTRTLFNVTDGGLRRQVQGNMRRIIVTKPGGRKRLRIEDHDPGPPGPGEVRVRVGAIGINYADIAVRLGIYDAVRDYPTCPGFDIAGRVESLGEGVTAHQEGDEVFGAVRFGAYSEIVNASEDMLWKVPDKLDLAEAAALPVNYVTAWYALFPLAGAREGEKVLIHSAAGGVGLAAAQLCRIHGLDAVGIVGGGHKIEPATTFGCRRVVASSQDDPWVQLKDEGEFDIVLDANGYSTLRNSYGVLGPRGRLVSYGFASMLNRGRDRLNWPALAWRWLRTPRFNPIDMVMQNRTVIGFNLVHLFREETLRDEAGQRLTEILHREDFMVPPVTRFAFEDVAAAHAWIESGDSVGKAVLEV